ncbi:MAG TPA: hypothetical protein G4N99_10370 [Thermoflexia bacterium]|nr:hypothetical protein [Thermoflexia bacterium]
MTDSIRRWRVLVPLLSVIALCLAAIRPWFRLEAVCTDDLSLHLLRAIQLESLLRQGVLFSRWAPDMVFGYGCPLFSVFTPLSYYVVVAFSLVGIGIQSAMLLTFALSIVGAGLAAYWLARGHFSPRSALVVAVAYAYAPYLGYDAFFRGNLAETLAWVFPPLAMGAIGRLAQRGGRRYLIAVALAFAAVMVTHNVFALAFGPLLAAYALVAVLTLSPAPSRIRRLIATGAALLLGTGLATFFWLPALIERAYVHMDRLLLPPDFIYWSNFIDLRELLALPRVVHPDLLNPSPPRGLGLLPVLMGLPAIVGLWRFRDKPRRTLILFFLLALVLYGWLTLPSSRIVWDNLPLLKYTHFPWRLLGPAALCLAMLTGTAAELLPTGRRGSLLTVIVIFILVLSALFWYTPRYCPWAETFDTVESISAFARATGLVCTTSKGEYVPRIVEAIPEETSSPLDPVSLPPGSAVVQHADLPVGDELIVTATRPFTAVYHSFYYPGWRVTIDGAPAPITPDAPYGRITFPVPEGRHRVSVRFTETPLRRTADYVSLACLLATVGLLLWPVRGGRPRPPISEDRLSPAWGGWGGVLLGIVLLLQRVNTPLRNPGLRGGALTGLDATSNTSFEGELTLLGFNQERTTIPSGDRVRFDLFWTARKSPSRSYQATIALVGPDGLRWNRQDSRPPRSFRGPPDTRLWPVGTYAQDSHYVETLPGTPPGTYDLYLILFDKETLSPLRVLESDGQPGPPDLLLGQLDVARPSTFVDPDELEMQHHLNVDLGSLTLLGVNLDRAEAAPGDLFLATFFWLADESPQADLIARFSLLDSDGVSVADFDLPPTNTSHPSSAWQVGDFWRGQHLLHLPAALNDGDYVWRITLLPPGRSINLPSPIHVTAPFHAFISPPLQYPIDVTLGGLATLVGFDLESETIQPGDTLTVTLAWRAEAETHTSYNVFLHLTAPDGALAAQSDGIPVDWTRPTTGWLPGEFIVDTHTLTLPTDILPGPYTLFAGLYEPDGSRLTVQDGSDVIPLATIELRGQ